MKHLKKVLSVILCVVLLAATFIAVIPEMTPDVSAATYRTAYNGPSSSYKGSKYYQHYQKITLTGDGVTDTLALALSQLGYHEGASTSDMDGISSSSGNYTEFNYNMGDWGSGYTYEWCATFCSWALYQSHTTNQGSMSDWCRRHSGDPNYIWREVGCPAWVSNLQAAGRWKYRSSGYKPQSGDLIFFRSAAHIGMVVYSDSSYVYTIEGNTSDQAGIEPAGGGVFFKKYELSNSGIDGYGVLPYKTNSSVTKIDYSGAKPTTGLYISNAVKYVYSTSTGSTVLENMPRFTMFEVTEIASNGRLKATYTNASGKTVTGWVLNNTDRVIQLTSSKPTAANLLDSAINTAKAARYDQYTEANLATLRSVYAEAVALRNTNASEASLTAMTTKLNNAINNTVANSESIVSKGKTYTVPDGGRADIYVDDGKRLTDGAKGTIDGGTDKFSGFNITEDKTSMDVVIDLGGNVSSNTYRIYTAKCADWGIASPEKIEVSVSNDGKNFTPIGDTTVRSRTFESDKWNMFTMTVNSKTTRTERYIKFTISKGSYVNADNETVISNHVWLEEVAVMNNPVAASGKAYVTGINQLITSGDTVIFTPDQGTITAADHNIRYTTNVVADWNGSRYVISSITQGKGADTPSITLKSNQILIAAHEWEGGTDDPVLGSYANAQLLKNANVGDALVLTNVDINGKALSAAPTIQVISNHTHTPGKEADCTNDQTCTGCGEVLVAAKGHDDGQWTTLTDGTKERRCTKCGALLQSVKPGENNLALNCQYTISGCGTGFDPYTANLTDGKCSDTVSYDENWFAFYYNSKALENVINAPNGVGYVIIDLGKVYSVDKINVHLVNDSKTAISKPEAVKVLFSIDGTDFTSAGSMPLSEEEHVAYWSLLKTEANARYVKIEFTLSDYFAFVDEIEVYGGDVSEIKFGDVNNDGKIDQYDYILVKRHYFNTRTLTNDEATRADANKDGKVDQFDYILIARHYFGTYVIG